ncbi:structural maintenance of chromosomes protein 6B-like isoform X1 [Papaver somniferum]|uniref:structural maintenance of chromosomes protein 6B-like isoform X1 n=1 Tax=Papaver somniferum TaxID=3469 RepID=UPI000E6FC89B|nr:structural maintenance of chromosomes protein 6B-like isoform X1 [Papaver somniferum]
MGDSGYPDTIPRPLPNPLMAGIIKKIHVENFMCHTSLDIELGECVNFITGQNGSGKSAILTALCVAFGSTAKGTQRAATLKDFIKTGCSYALVCVEIKNQGEEAFKPEIYGDVIIVERRVTESSGSTIALKNHQGKKVASRRADVMEIVEHFNIDVENPCVIMSQDKSREFLHSGNDKDKFRFFFKATLLQQVSDLLHSINDQLDAANAQVEEYESSIRPIMKELNELKAKIKSMEHVEEISQQLELVRKKLAWAIVYDTNRKVQEQAAKLEKLKERIPACQAKVDRQLLDINTICSRKWLLATSHMGKVKELKEHLAEKRNQIDHMMEKTSEFQRLRDELQQDLTLVSKSKHELEEEHTRKRNHIQKLVKRVSSLEKQIYEFQEQHVKNTQVEESELEAQLKAHQDEFDAATACITRLKEEEYALTEEVSMTMRMVDQFICEIQDAEHKRREHLSHISELRQRHTNKVTAFGGNKVIQLLQVIERRHREFKIPPIGPIGAHLNLVGGDTWALAVENAVGMWFNAFIVTDHGDFLLLRECARSVNYNLKILIYDFSRPRLNIPDNMLPHTSHPTVLSVLQSDNPTVLNVLVDMGNAERQVLVSNYDVGKSVAFDQRIPNLKEVFTSDGTKMFSRGLVQTTLPPNKWTRSGRLCGSVDGQIDNIEEEASKMQDKVRQGQVRKRDAEGSLQELKGRLNSVKRRRLNAERDLTSKELKLQDLKDSCNSYAAEPSSSPASNANELREEISKIDEELKEKEVFLETLQERIKEAAEKAKEVKLSIKNLSESAKGDIDALDRAEQELIRLEDELITEETAKSHYEGLMHSKVLPDIEEAEKIRQQLQSALQEDFKKASNVCAESVVEALGGCAGETREQLGAQFSKLKHRREQESQRYSESIDDLRALHEKKERKIIRKKQTYEAFREKLDACQKALQLRTSKFERNASFLKRQLTWQFNKHLTNKGISGNIKLSYEEKTLALEVKMPQDTSNNNVRDTRGLSGGERSFSTLCFALALHDITEAPFRAMDEFDVFMDAVSRKISLDTLVKFAVEHGAQWIFITPHDISMVTPGERVKKQQMVAPRS